jgi:CubicO group peptidase (beta-lactamase class C family)
MKKLLIVIGLIVLLLGTAYRPLLPDEEALADPLITRDNWHQKENRVYSYSGALEGLFPYHIVKKGPVSTPLPEAEHPMVFWYTFDGNRYNSDEYLTRNRVTGFLVLKDGQIVLERYQYDRNKLNRFLSKSMAKSVISLLVGIAIAEGHIKSIDDLAKQYVPKLAGHPYGETSLRHLLQMSSGVEWIEINADGTPATPAQTICCADILERGSWLGQGPGGVETVMPFKKNKRISEPGTKFNYSSAETQVLGLVLRQAIGKSLSDYLSEKIWQPMGAESDATWFIDKSGQEPGYNCINATLRDYARLGMLLANDGIANGKQIVPKEWVREATQPTPGYPHLMPDVALPGKGYGYQFWVFPGDNRRFALQGKDGQKIYVDPKLKLVMVQTALDDNTECARLWRGIVATYGSW